MRKWLRIVGNGSGGRLLFEPKEMGPLRRIHRKGGVVHVGPSKPPSMFESTDALKHLYAESAALHNADQMSSGLDFHITLLHMAGMAPNENVQPIACTSCSNNPLISEYCNT